MNPVEWLLYAAACQLCDRGAKHWPEARDVRSYGEILQTETEAGTSE